jgi:Flp pilus assembly protein TadD
LQKALFDNQLAVDLAPSSPEALASQSALLILSGKSGQALKMINLALELSPFDPQLADFLTLKCKALIQFHEYSQAVTFCARSVALRPDWRNVSALVVSYMIIGDLDHVKQTKALLLRVKPDFTVQTCRETLDAMSENPEYRGFTERFAFYLKQAGLPE